MVEHEHDSKGDKSFKIVDRRRFNSEGETRADAPEEKPTPVTELPRQEPPRAPAAASTQQAPSSPASAAYNIDFISFAASLATNALAALGALPENAGPKMPKNPELARDYIDILAMLQDKTRGNLTAEEASALQRLVTELRLTFVEATQPKGR